MANQQFNPSNEKHITLIEEGKSRIIEAAYSIIQEASELPDSAKDVFGNVADKFTATNLDEYIANLEEPVKSIYQDLNEKVQNEVKSDTKGLGQFATLIDEARGPGSTKRLFSTWSVQEAQGIAKNL